MSHLYLIGVVAVLAALACGGPAPTPTQDYNAGQRYMQTMPCDALIRYADAVILRAEDEGGWTYDGLTDLALLINRVARGEIEPNSTITRSHVSDRLDECEGG